MNIRERSGREADELAQQPDLTGGEHPADKPADPAVRSIGDEAAERVKGIFRQHFEGRKHDDAVGVELVKHERSIATREWPDYGDYDHVLGSTVRADTSDEAQAARWERSANTRVLLEHEERKYWNHPSHKHEARAQLELLDEIAFQRAEAVRHDLKMRTHVPKESFVEEVADTVSDLADWHGELRVLVRMLTNEVLQLKAELRRKGE